VERTSDGAMLTTKSADLRLVLPRPFFADARFSGASLSDKPVASSLLTRRTIGSLERPHYLCDRLIEGHGSEDANIVL
jgi:hypothetical protein